MLWSVSRASAARRDRWEAYGTKASCAIFMHKVAGLLNPNADMAKSTAEYSIGDKQPLNDLKVALARQHENYRFASDPEFARTLKEGDLYGLRVCRHLLEGLENYDFKRVPN